MACRPFRVMWYHDNLSDWPKILWLYRDTVLIRRPFLWNITKKYQIIEDQDLSKLHLL